MKRVFIIVLLVCMTFPIYAQKVIENDEVLATVGVNVPMYKGIENDVVAGIHYGHYYHNGMGFRAGFQYSPSVADISNCFGVPLAFTFRTRSRSLDKRLESATEGAFESAAYSGDDAVKSGFSGFLMNLFDRVEFSAGLTPGYVAGKNTLSGESITTVGEISYKEKTWTEKPCGFSLSLDAGFNINLRIWRFDLKLMPAFHYNITDNYRYHIHTSDSAGHESVNVRPVKWFFTFSGGLAFRF